MPIPPGSAAPSPGRQGTSVRAAQPVSLYVQVRDIAASLVAVADLGGVVQSQPFDVPGGPTIAFVADPEGNSLVLVQQ
jgi:predicted enzyme related to lactoylglutathione lyase